MRGRITRRSSGRASPAAYRQVVRLRQERIRLFVGHYSPAFVAKAAAPRVPLWTLLLAAQFVDILWSLCVFAGIEHVRLVPGLPSNPLDLYHMPYTHSLLATV